jgi:hypothetical protein
MRSQPLPPLLQLLVGGTLLFYFVRAGWSEHLQIRRTGIVRRLAAPPIVREKNPRQYRLILIGRVVIYAFLLAVCIGLIIDGFQRLFPTQPVRSVTEPRIGPR